MGKLKKIILQENKVVAFYSNVISFFRNVPTCFQIIIFHHQNCFRNRLDVLQVKNAIFILFLLLNHDYMSKSISSRAGMNQIKVEFSILPEPVYTEEYKRIMLSSHLHVSSLWVTYFSTLFGGSLKISFEKYSDSN